MTISNKKILITGGASGIGRGLMERFIKDNNTVIICGRRQKVLQDAARQNPGIITHQCDLEVEAGRMELYNWISENHSDLNVLVNNAGMQNWMKVTDEDFFQKTKQEVEINVLAPIHLSQLFLKLNSFETIINVTSGLAFTPLTRVPVYSATKAFFRSFTRSLRHQLQEADVKVIEIIPPKLNTDLGGKGLHDDAPPVSEFLDSVFEALRKGETEIGYKLSAELLNKDKETTTAHFNKLNSLS